MRSVFILAVLCLVTGCGVTDGAGPVASPAGFGPTVAFESVDGPPPQIFDRLVRALESETAGRSFTIVSRDVQAAYRVRSYLSAQVQRGGRTTIAWVWDVYDRDHQRALRLSGEEAAGRSGGDAWAAADDQILRRIAQAGLNGVNGLINGTLPAEEAPAPAPPSGGPAIAQADGNRPEPESQPIQALAFSAR